MHDRLKPFTAQLSDGKIPAAGIVRMANGGKSKDQPLVTVADVEAARAELAGAAAAPAPTADAPADALAAPDAPAPVVAPVASEPAPSHVIVVANGTRTFHNGPHGGRSFMVGYRGVHKGDEAAWLWTNHRALVEPFDPTPRLPRK